MSQTLDISNFFVGSFEVGDIESQLYVACNPGETKNCL